MAIAFVQYDDYYNSVTGGTIANDTALNTTTGNFIVAIIGTYASNGVVSKVEDTAGNTYVKAVGEFRAGTSTERQEIWYAENITGNAANVTTATFTASTTRYISVAEFSGVATSSSLDDTSYAAMVTQTTHSSGNATSSAAGGLIIGGLNLVDSENVTKGAGFTDLSSDITLIYEYAEYMILGAAGDYDADCTTGTTSSSIMACVIFKAGEAASGATTNCQINIGDAWKTISGSNVIKVNVGDAWKGVAAMKVNVGDSWKACVIS